MTTGSIAIPRTIGSKKLSLMTSRMYVHYLTLADTTGHIDAEDIRSGNGSFRHLMGAIAVQELADLDIISVEGQIHIPGEDENDSDWDTERLFGDLIGFTHNLHRDETITIPLLAFTGGNPATFIPHGHTDPIPLAATGLNARGLGLDIGSFTNFLNHLDPDALTGRFTERELTTLLGMERPLVKAGGMRRLARLLGGAFTVRSPHPATGKARYTIDWSHLDKPSPILADKHLIKILRRLHAEAPHAGSNPAPSAQHARPPTTGHKPAEQSSPAVLLHEPPAVDLSPLPSLRNKVEALLKINPEISSAETAHEIGTDKAVAGNLLRHARAANGSPSTARERIAAILPNEPNITGVEVARRFGIDESHARRILRDLRGATTPARPQPQITEPEPTSFNAGPIDPTARLLSHFFTQMFEHGFESTYTNAARIVHAARTEAADAETKAMDQTFRTHQLITPAYSQTIIEIGLAYGWIPFPEAGAA